MSKTYKGYELYKMIAEGKIKEGTKFKDNNRELLGWNGTSFIGIRDYADIVFATMDFELIEDEIEESNIQQMSWTEIGETLGKKFLEISEGMNNAVKQLDRKSK